jgi:type IV fimbrial biogenesis protein FimT
MNRYKQTMGGFTLVELVVTMAIAAIILTQAVPSFSTMISNNRLTTQTNNLVADINLARSEAVKRGLRVILCRTADPYAAAATCGGTANTWSTGWLLYADDDGSGVYESANDTLIRVGAPAVSTVAVKTNSTSNNNLEYNPDGTTNEGGSTAIFAICDDRGTANGLQINVNGMGRPRLISSPLTTCTP